MLAESEEQFELVLLLLDDDDDDIEDGGESDKSTLLLYSGSICRLSSQNIARVQ